MVEKLLTDGFKLVVVGQTVVASFIGLMLLTMKLIAWGVKRFEKPALPGGFGAADPIPGNDEEDEALAAAMAAAVHHKRSET